MMVSNSVNAVQSNSSVAELTVQVETISHREPPPPYSAFNAHHETHPVVNQPIIHQTIIVQAPLLDKPTVYNCNTCGEQVLTKVELVNTRKTHMLAGFICGLTCWCLMCCLGAIPYVIPALKKSKHYCPNCNNFLGDYSKI